MLSRIIEEEIPSLREVLAQQNQLQPPQRVPFDELFRYVELVRECRLGSQLMIVSNEDKKFLAVFDQLGEVDRIAEISQEEALLLVQRQKFIGQLNNKEQQYSQSHNQQNLS